MHLAVTTACNFRCSFCPLVELQRPASRLEYSLIEKILSECAEHRLTNRVTFHLMGEALLHPQCMDVLRLCRKYSMHTRFVTNGALYKEEKYRDPFDIVDTLDISFRTVDDMEVQQVQQKLTFDEYLDRVAASVDLRESIMTSPTRIRLRLFISPKTMPSLKSLCQRLDIPSSVLRAGSGNIQPYQEFNPRDWLTFLCESERDWKHTMNLYQSKFGNCQEYEKYFSIISSGSVTSCCWGAHGENIMGNLNEHSLVEILENEDSHRFRNSFRRHVCPTEKCRKCLGRPTWSRSMAYQALSLVNLR